MIFSQQRLARTLAREQQQPRWPYGFRQFPADFFDGIVDLGANCGMVTVALRMLFPTARILAVEPHPDNFCCLEKNVEGLRVETVHGALSDHNPVQLNVDRVLGCCRTHETGRKEPTIGSVWVPGYELADIAKLIAHDAAANAVADAATDVAASTSTGTASTSGILALKCDCEGAEILLRERPSEEAALRRFRYAAFELHNGAASYKPWLESLGKLVHWRDRGRLGYAEVLIDG